MVPTTEVHICNLALDRIGQASITSISPPNSREAEIVARWYEPTRRELYRAFLPTFARKLAQLTVDPAKTPAYGYSSAYRYPNDFIRLMALGDTTIDNDTPHNLYELSEGYIFTDSGDSGTLNMIYIHDHLIVAKYDPLFVKLFFLQLGANMAYKFTLRGTVKNDLLKELEDVKIQAAAIWGQEKRPRRVDRSKWKARRIYGMNTDPTRW